MEHYALREISREYPVWYENGVVFGRVKRCFVAIRYTDGQFRFSIYIGSPHRGDRAALLDRARDAASIIRWDTTDLIYGIHNPRLDAPNSCQRILADGAILQVDLSAAPSYRCNRDLPVRQLRAFIENILPKIEPLTAPNTCARCGLPIAPSERMPGADSARDPNSLRPVSLSEDVVVPMHLTCSEGLPSPLDKRPAGEVRKARIRRLLLDLLKGLAALLAAVLYILSRI